MKRRGNVPPQVRQVREQGALWFLAFTLLLSGLACNAFAGNLVTPVPPPTTAPAATATAVPVTAPGLARLTVLVDLNVRAGPGVQYERLSYLTAGATAVITGRDPQSDWLQIACPADVVEAECWVAGGAQFVDAPTRETLPDVRTPPPPTPDAGGALETSLAFVSEGQLQVAGLDVAQDPPGLATSPLPLTSGAAVSTFAFSPDGKTIAYLSSDGQVNALHVVSVDGREPRLLVNSRALPFAAGRDSTRFAVQIDQVSWFPDSRTLAFNTALANLEGPGRQSQEDLWTVDLDGELRELFAPGLGGGSFLLLGQDRALLGKTDALLQANLTALTSEVALTFTRVNTASEVAYYPRPQQTEAGVLVAIPAAEPWQEGALTTLWQVPVSGGGAAATGQLRDVLLTEPVLWSDDGSRLAFVQRASSEGQGLPRLVLAGGGGGAAEPYTGGEGLTFFDWSPAVSAFLYAGAGFYAVGQPGSPAQQTVLPAGREANTAVWLSTNTFLVSSGSAAEGSWQIKSANSSGSEQSLVMLRGQAAPFAVWPAP